MTVTEEGEEGAGGVDIDLDRLDEPGGMDAVLAEFESDEFEGRAEPARPGGGRPMWISAIVVAVGLYLMWGMWDDFRFWLRADDDIRDLGTADDILEDGEFKEDYHNELVRLRARPDVQYVARLTKEGTTLGKVLRLTEGGGSLFAELVGVEDSYTAYEGEFVGRMIRMDGAPGIEHLVAYFDSRGIVESHDVETSEFLAALGRSGQLEIKTATGGTIKLTDEHIIRMTVKQPEAFVQMGISTWPKEADARAEIEGLGYPYVPYQARRTARDTEAEEAGKKPNRRPFHGYLVRIPDGEREGVEAKLNAGRANVEDNRDPKVGAMVLPKTASYGVAAPDVAVTPEGDIAFAWGDNTSSPGYELKGGKLVPREIRNDQMLVPASALRSAYVERLVKVNPQGYLVRVGVLPSHKRLEGLLFLVACALVFGNAVVLVTGLRARARA